MTNHISKTFGDYQILEEIGRGRMAVGLQEYSATILSTVNEEDTNG